MQTHVVGKDLRSFRDSAEEPLGISDGVREAEEKANEKSAANQEECSSEGAGHPQHFRCCLVYLFVSSKRP